MRRDGGRKARQAKMATSSGRKRESGRRITTRAGVAYGRTVEAEEAWDGRRQGGRQTWACCGETRRRRSSAAPPPHCRLYQPSLRLCILAYLTIRLQQRHKYAHCWWRRRRRWRTPKHRRATARAPQVTAPSARFQPAALPALSRWRRAPAANHLSTLHAAGCITTH